MNERRAASAILAALALTLGACLAGCASYSGDSSSSSGAGMGSSMEQQPMQADSAQGMEPMASPTDTSGTPR